MVVADGLHGDATAISDFISVCLERASSDERCRFPSCRRYRSRDTKNGDLEVHFFFQFSNAGEAIGPFAMHVVRASCQRTALCAYPARRYSLTKNSGKTRLRRRFAQNALWARVKE
jgi:hypothetical protein